MKTTIVSDLNGGMWGVLSNYEDDRCVRLERGVWGVLSNFDNDNWSSLNGVCVGRVV